MDVVKNYDGNSNFTHRRKAFRSTKRGDWGRGLHAQWSSLNRAIFAAINITYSDPLSFGPLQK
jgi:hypothetical protein